MNIKKNNTPAISIIVPVYDTSDYLKKCLDSIINQSLINIEIIIINDCSPDPLDHDICTDYEKKDPRVIYIKHKTNRGLGGARNSGLNIAHGDYIWFIDSDDFIDINACEFLYYLADTQQAEIIAFSATSHINGNLDLSSYDYYNYNRDISILNKLFNGKDFIDIAILTQSFHVSACLHLFKKSLFLSYKFRENVVHEDTDLIPIIIHNASFVFCTKYAPYYRLLREGSITQTIINERRLIDKFLCVNSLLSYLNEQDIKMDDPLVIFMVNEFTSLTNIYSKFDKKTDLTEKKFILLNNKYNSFVREPLPIIHNKDTLNEKYLHIKHELENIKGSRFWKVSEFLRKLKS